VTCIFFLPDNFSIPVSRVFIVFVDVVPESKFDVQSVDDASSVESEVEVSEDEVRQKSVRRVVAGNVVERVRQSSLSKVEVNRGTFGFHRFEIARVVK
jgi:hypothetical protein